MELIPPSGCISCCSQNPCHRARVGTRKEEAQCGGAGRAGLWEAAACVSAQASSQSCCVTAFLLGLSPLPQLRCSPYLGTPCPQHHGSRDRQGLAIGLAAPWLRWLPGHVSSLARDRTSPHSSEVFSSLARGRHSRGSAAQSRHFSWPVSWPSAGPLRSAPQPQTPLTAGLALRMVARRPCGPGARRGLSLLYPQLSRVLLGLCMVT